MRQAEYTETDHGLRLATGAGGEWIQTDSVVVLTDWA
jgi:hypothetical protein